MSRKVTVRTALLRDAYSDANASQRDVLFELFPPYEERGEEFEVEAAVLKEALRLAGACTKWTRIVNNMVSESGHFAIKNPLPDDLVNEFERAARKVLSSGYNEACIQILAGAADSDGEYKRGFWLHSDYEWELTRRGSGYVLIPKIK